MDWNEPHDYSRHHTIINKCFFFWNVVSPSYHLIELTLKNYLATQFHRSFFSWLFLWNFEHNLSNIDHLLYSSQGLIQLNILLMLLSSNQGLGLKHNHSFYIFHCGFSIRLCLGLWCFNFLIFFILKDLPSQSRLLMHHKNYLRMFDLQTLF